MSFLILTLVALPAAAQDSNGQIAITGVDGNIYIYDMASQVLTPVTTDGSTSRPQRLYNAPIWSTDGQLAYFGSSYDPDNPFGLGIFIKQPGKEAKGVFASEEEFYTYAYWSPADCPAGNCRDLAVLYTNATGLAARLIRSSDKFEITEISEGGPFYWDWSPDGASMFWARYAQTLEIYDVATNEAELLPFAQGLTQTVDWSPTDDRLLAAVSDEAGGTDLAIIENGEERILAEGVNSGLAAHWSPTGEQVAYLDLRGGELRVLDANTGTEIATPSVEVITFLWSPDGSKLAYLTFTDSADRPNAKHVGTPYMASVPMTKTLADRMYPVPTDNLLAQQEQSDFLLRWNVYDVASDTSTELAAFFPSQEMIYYLNFFDQFSHSHELWSPDSRYIVYGEVTEDGSQQVSLVDVQNPRATPIKVAEGTMGIFSW